MTKHLNKILIQTYLCFTIINLNHKTFIVFLIFCFVRKKFYSKALLEISFKIANNLVRKFTIFIQNIT